MKKGILATIFGFFTLLFSQLVSAAPPASGAGARAWVQYILTMQYLSDIGLIQGTIDPMEGFVRLLILIFFFTALFVAGRFVKLTPWIAGVVAFIFAAIGMLFIPGSVLVAAAASYGVIFSVILLAIPILIILGLFFFAKDFPWIRTVLLALLWFVLNRMKYFIVKGTGLSGPVYSKIIVMIADKIDWITWIVIFAFFISLIMALVSLGSGFVGEDLNVKGTAQWVYNKMKTKSRRAKTASMNSYIENEKELHLIDEALKSRNDALVLVQGALTARQLADQPERDRIVAGVKKVSTDMDKARKEFSRVFTRARRERAQIVRASKQLRSLKDELKENDKSIDELEALENTTLQKRDEAYKDLDRAQRDYAGVLAQLKVLQSVTAFPTTWPASGGAVPVARIRSALVAIQQGLTNVDLTAAEAAQKEVLKAMQGAMIEARELFRWKN